MKYRIRLLAALAAMALIAAACGDTADEVEDAAPATTATTAAPTDTAPATTAAPEAPATTQADDSAPDTTAAPAEPAEPAGTLVVTETFGPNAGWGIETDDALLFTNYGIAEPLVVVDFDGNLVPGLATSWERRSELEWAFEIRSGVTFHDGSDLTATAVADALNYLLDSPTPPRGLSRSIVATVAVEGDSTVVMTTNGPDAVLPQRLVSGNSAILSPSAYLPDRTIDPFAGGTGPFLLVDIVPDQLIRLEANPNYWGEAPKLAGFEVFFVPDGQVRSGMLRSGEAQIIAQVPITDLPLLEGDPNLVVLKTPLPRTTSVYLNNIAGPTTNQTVREAINYAIDRELIAAAVLEGSDDPAIGPFPFWEEWADPTIRAFPYEPDTARALLAEAGYGDDNPLRLRLWTYIERPQLSDIAVAMQAMLRDVGISTELTITEYGPLEGSVLAGDFDLFILSRSHLLDVYDPIGFLEADYGCEGGYNLSHFCDAEFDAALTAARGMDTAERYAVYGELSGVLQDRAITGFLTHQIAIDAHSSNVVGYRTHPMGHYVITTDVAVTG